MVVVLTTRASARIIQPRRRFCSSPPPSCCYSRAAARGTRRLGRDVLVEVRQEVLRLLHHQVFEHLRKNRRRGDSGAAAFSRRGVPTQQRMSGVSLGCLEASAAAASPLIRPPIRLTTPQISAGNNHARACCDGGLASHIWPSACCRRMTTDSPPRERRGDPPPLRRRPRLGEVPPPPPPERERDAAGAAAAAAAPPPGPPPLGDSAEGAAPASCTKNSLRFGLRRSRGTLSQSDGQRTSADCDSPLKAPTRRTKHEREAGEKSTKEPAAGREQNPRRLAGWYQSAPAEVTESGVARHHVEAQLALVVVLRKKGGGGERL